MSNRFSSLSLIERSSISLSHYDTLTEDKKKLAKARLEKWKESAHLNSVRKYDAWKRHYNISDRSMPYLLAGDLTKSDMSSDLIDLTNIYNLKMQMPELELDSLGQKRHLVVFVLPVLRVYFNRLVTTLENSEIGFRRENVDLQSLCLMLTSSLADRLLDLVFRVLLLELQIMKLQGQLKGGSSEQRFQYFLDQFLSAEFCINIYKSYPILARQVCCFSRHWLEENLRFVGRFIKDVDIIFNKILKKENDITLEKIDCHAGDQHDSGQTVKIIYFNDSSKVVYKPRSLKIDEKFSVISKFLCDKLKLDFKMFLTVDCGDYGWQEYVEKTPCGSMSEVEHFYTRQGYFIALIYALCGNDIHFENVISCGEYPVIIDLETQIQPLIEDPTPMGLGSRPESKTVLRTGILPQKVNGVDLSAFASFSTKASRIEFEDVEKDSMHMVYRSTQTMSVHNLPQLNGVCITVDKMIPQVLGGFREMYKILINNREKLLNDPNLIPSLKNVTIRTIFRGTLIYAQILEQCLHPEKLQNAIDWDRCFDKLWIDSEYFPSIERIISTEKVALWQLDVPRFTVQANSRDLNTPSGEVIRDFFENSGYASVIDRMSRLSPQDMLRQEWIIETALNTCVDPNDLESWKPQKYSGEVRFERKDYINQAHVIERRLSLLSVQHKGYLSWFDMHTDYETVFDIRVLDVGLYSGMAGIALFYAQLFRVSGKEKYLLMLKKVVETIGQRVKFNSEALTNIGVYSGWGGLIYMYSYLAKLFPEEGYIDCALALVERIEQGVEQDRVLDITGGASGALISLVRLYNVSHDSVVLKAILSCVCRLKNSAIYSEFGICWPTMNGTFSVPITGFGHGTAGIVWALAHANTYLKDDEIDKLVQGGLTYERNSFCQKEQAWPDLRENRTEKDKLSFNHAWCHGSMGIGLSRIDIAKLIDDPYCSSEVYVALNAVRREGFGGRHCLCHGDLGNLDLLLNAREFMSDNDNINTSISSSQILNSIIDEGVKCGASKGREILGLMTGISGVGYQLLRVADANQVPSVLLLELPCG